MEMIYQLCHFKATPVTALDQDSEQPIHEHDIQLFQFNNMVSSSETKAK